MQLCMCTQPTFTAKHTGHINLNITQIIANCSLLHIFTAIRLVYSRFGRHRVHSIELIHILFPLCRAILAVLWYVRRTEPSIWLELYHMVHNLAQRSTCPQYLLMLQATATGLTEQWQHTSRLGGVIFI